MKKISIMIITVILFFSSICLAFECNNKIIHTGLYKFDVIACCGFPIMRNYIGINGKEQWFYIIKKHGINQKYLLEFDCNGVLNRIEWLGELR